jgi:hypothetical protein
VGWGLGFHLVTADWLLAHDFEWILVGWNLSKVARTMHPYSYQHQG